MRRRLVMAVVIACAGTLAAAPAFAGDDDDERIAKRAVLKASDLPDDWESAPNPEEDSNDLPECEETNRADDRADRNPSARSREFTDPDAPRGIRSVENSVWVFPNKRAAKRFFAVFDSNAGIDCLFASAHEIAREIGLEDVRLEPIALESFGDDAVGYSAIVGDGDPVNSIYFELVLVRVGRAATGFTAQNLGGSLPQGADIVDAVVGRLERGL